MFEINSLGKRFHGKITAAKSEELFLLVTKHSVTVRFLFSPFCIVDEFENVIYFLATKIICSLSTLSSFYVLEIYMQRLGPSGTRRQKSPVFLLL